MSAKHCVEVAKLNIENKSHGRVLRNLALYANDDGICSLSPKYLSRRLDMTEQQVMSVIKALTIDAYIKTTRRGKRLEYKLTLQSKLKLVPSWLKLSRIMIDYAYDALLGSWWSLPHSNLDVDSKTLAVSLRWRHIALSKRCRDAAEMIIDERLRNQTFSDIAAMKTA